MENTVEVCWTVEEGDIYEEVVVVVSIDYYLLVKGDSRADNPDDYYGYEECDTSIVDVYVDNGKMDTKLAYKESWFQNEKFEEKVLEAVREKDEK